MPIKVDSSYTWYGCGCDGPPRNPQLSLAWFCGGIVPAPRYFGLTSPQAARLLVRKGVSPWGGVDFVVWDLGTRSGFARLGLGPRGGM